MNRSSIARAKNFCLKRGSRKEIFPRASQQSGTWFRGERWGMRPLLKRNPRQQSTRPEKTKASSTCTTTILSLPPGQRFRSASDSSRCRRGSNAAIHTSAHPWGPVSSRFCERRTTTRQTRQSSRASRSSRARPAQVRTRLLRMRLRILTTLRSCREQRRFGSQTTTRGPTQSLNTGRSRRGEVFFPTVPCITTFRSAFRMSGARTPGRSAPLSPIRTR